MCLFVIMYKGVLSYTHFLFFALLTVHVHLLLLLQDLSDFVFIHWLSLIIEFEFVFGASHAEDFEAVDFGDELGGSGRNQFRIRLQFPHDFT